MHQRYISPARLFPRFQERRWEQIWLGSSHGNAFLEVSHAGGADLDVSTRFVIWFSKPPIPASLSCSPAGSFPYHLLHSLRGKWNHWMVHPRSLQSNSWIGPSISPLVGPKGEDGVRVMLVLSHRMRLRLCITCSWAWEAGTQWVANKCSSFPDLDFTIFSPHLVKGCNLCCVCPFTSHYIPNERRDETYSLFKASKIGLINMSNWLFSCSTC